MKIFFCLLIIFTFQTIQSQNYRVAYKLEYKRDSTNLNLTPFTMILDIQTKHTKFYFQKLLVADSILRKRNKPMSLSFPVQQILKRKVNSFENENFVNVQDKYFSFSTIDKMEWKILDSLKQFENYKLQKAETSWGGRKWYAWFCADIPIPEGPYKFRGLPGLIMLLNDNKNNFFYSVISLKKMNEGYDTGDIVETSLRLKPLQITLQKYQKLLLDSYNNPFSQYENMKGTLWQLTIFDKKINTLEGLQTIKKQYQTDIKKNYNPIEIDKAVTYSD